jgi:hypothetical protein
VLNKNCRASKKSKIYSEKSENAGRAKFDELKNINKNSTREQTQNK